MKQVDAAATDLTDTLDDVRIAVALATVAFTLIAVVAITALLRTLPDTV